MEYLEYNKMDTLDSRANTPGPEQTRKCIPQGAHSALNQKHVGQTESRRVENAKYCGIRTDTQYTRYANNRRGIYIF